MLRVTYVNIVQFTPWRYTLHERSVVIVQYKADSLAKDWNIEALSWAILM